jgi:hypothetical protein
MTGQIPVERIPHAAAVSSGASKMQSSERTKP